MELLYLVRETTARCNRSDYISLEKQPRDVIEAIIPLSVMYKIVICITSNYPTTFLVWIRIRGLTITVK